MDKPGWMDVFNKFWEVKSSDMWTAFPGKCISYDSTKRNGTIEVLVKYLQGEDNIPKKIPNLTEVPVMMIGNQYATVNLPKLGDGSYGLVIVCNHDITDWVTGSGQAVLPTEERRWNINDGFFMPGAFANGSPYQGIVDDDVLDVSVKKGTKIKIGNGSVDLLDILDQTLTALGGAQVQNIGAAATPGPLINAPVFNTTIKNLLDQIKA